MELTTESLKVVSRTLQSEIANLVLKRDRLTKLISRLRRAYTIMDKIANDKLIVQILDPAITQDITNLEQVLAEVQEALRIRARRSQDKPTRIAWDTKPQAKGQRKTRIRVVSQKPTKQNLLQVPKTEEISAKLEVPPPKPKPVKSTPIAPETELQPITTAITDPPPADTPKVKLIGINSNAYLILRANLRKGVVSPNSLEKALESTFGEAWVERKIQGRNYLEDVRSSDGNLRKILKDAWSRLLLVKGGSLTNDTLKALYDAIDFLENEKAVLSVLRSWGVFN